MPSPSYETFDQLLEEILGELPPEIRSLLDEVPLVVENEPSPAVRGEFGIPLDEPESDLCGGHWGIPLNERSVFEPGFAPERIMLFRGPIWRLGGGKLKSVRKQILITLLHELGHHFGMTEEELIALGYG